MNLLLFSQESGRLLEVSRSGVVLSSLDFSAISSTTEGVTITADGTIFLTDETPNIYMLTAAPVPEPATYALMLRGGRGGVISTVGSDRPRRRPAPPSWRSAGSSNRRR